MQQRNFIQTQRQNQISWRESNVSTAEWGYQNGGKYEHVIPRGNWIETVYQPIRAELTTYLIEKKVKEHTGVHNLMSSWILSANLYFPVLSSEVFRILMLQFLQERISNEITELVDIQLEFAFDYGDALHPSLLLGEMDGSRGSGQTSPDVAFLVKTKKGDGIILTECKYSEHSFYSCSARTVKGRQEKPDNPDPKRCMEVLTGDGYKSICHQSVWGRKYWGNLQLSEMAHSKIKRCPAATDGYQLFRQQSLAEGIARCGKYDLVASTVAFDGRNSNLISCLKTTGINDFQTGWCELWTGKAIFKTWHHQEWVHFVRTHQKDGCCNDWLNYMKSRYGY
ncbi:PGN_0703 family putative restriction endonuclease [Natronoflexus pectinivorans]|uniref:Uncharacterized protein n=1 Tax=Natronoflexus pectinivorans TaxID=682526 RepID=A0A4R2GFM4_9BACT|nr:hypothetical protein [Natronoflexus pectinivorans]TCO06966.1 hypothetical protein EV194_11186 [Natronoflexus pectinivorans]